MDYILKHKDIDCGYMSIDEITGEVTSFALIDENAAPFLGKCSMSNINKWWDMRSISGNRENLEDLLKSKGCMTRQAYLLKNLGLSLTDTYWICPVDKDMSWEDINPYVHRDGAYTCNASLSGDTSKKWDLGYSKPILIKEMNGYGGIEAVNEAFSSYINEMQKNNIAYAKYAAIKSENRSKSGSASFCTEELEYVSAREIVNGDNLADVYEEYIYECSAYGIREDVIRDNLDYQVLIDFLMSNKERSLSDFGILRDSDTLEFIMPAPLYDFSRSMYYDQKEPRVYHRGQILNKGAGDFVKRTKPLLDKVENRRLLDTTLLPSKEMTREFYIKYGVPSNRAYAVAENFEIKKGLLEEFQKGKDISRYIEKVQER